MMISLGGTLGGVFVAIIAPHVFHTYLELPLSMVACRRWPPSFSGSHPAIGTARASLTFARSLWSLFTVGLAIHLGYEKFE